MGIALKNETEPGKEIQDGTAKKETGSSVAMELAALREENARLHHELSEGRKVQQVTVEKIVPPRDYEQLRRKCDNLMAQNHAYRSIIEHGSITTIENLVEKYIVESKSQLRKINAEASVTSFSRDTAYEVGKLIEHFDNAKMHLRTLIAVQLGGNLVFQPKLRSAQMKAEEISHMMGSLDSLKGITEQKADELLSSLTNMAEFLAEFLAEVKGTLR